MYKYQQDQLEKSNPFYSMSPVKPKKDPNDIRVISMMGSPAHTYGNALAFMQNYIINLFPKELFKSIHVSSKIAHRQLKSTNHEFLKKTKPIIGFRPRIADQSEDRFLQGTPWIERQTDIYSTWGATNLQPFFQDPNHDLNIKFQMNRSVMYVDVVCVFSTLIQQINYRSYLENAVRIGHSFAINTFFESYIPQELLAIVSDICGIPMFDSHGSSKDFLQYISQNSIYPVTYKLQGSSGTKEFYRFYPVNIDTTISDLQTDEGEKVGHVMNSYQMSFTVKMEYNSTGFYYAFSDKLKDDILPTVFPETATVIPVYTDVIKMEDLHLAPGWHLYNRNSCRLETEDDFVCIDSMLNNSIRAAINYHAKDGLPIFEFLDIKVRRQGEFMVVGKDYTVDYDTMTINFINQNTYYTYQILVCINAEYINELVKKVYGLQ